MNEEMRVHKRETAAQAKGISAPRASSSMLHPFSLICWLGAVLTALSLTRNPLYLILVLLCIAIVGTATRPNEPSTLPLRPVRLAVVLLLFSVLFNGLTVHYGDTVFARLPAWLPAIGGPLTVEAFVYGALNGLVLIGFFSAFTVLTTTLSTSALIRLIPAAFYPVAVVISIAVSFVPTTLRQIGQIREAQAVRGHRMRGWHAWLPLWMPLLVGSLERAIQLAEAMVARGFASSDEPRPLLADQLLLVGGLVSICGGWLLRLAWGIEQLGIAAMLCGVGLVVAALWRAGRRVPRTHYREQQWRVQDTVVAVATLIAIVILLVPLPFIDRTSLFFYPYPRVQLPTFNSAIGISLLLLLAPAAWNLQPSTRVQNRAAP